MDTSQQMRFSVINGDFRIMLRTKPKIIRYVKYNQKVDPENYFREQLMLFYPWRKEETDLLNGHDTYDDHFKAIQETIQLRRKDNDANAELLDKVELATEAQTEVCFDAVSPNIKSVEANDAQTEPMQSVKYAFYKPETRDYTYYD